MRRLFRLSRRPSIVMLVLLAAGVGASPGAMPSAAQLTGATTVNNNKFTAAPDWQAPVVTAELAAIESDTLTGGVLRRGATFRVYATIADGGAPASGIAGVTADVSALSAGSTNVPLVAGSYTFPAGGQAYGYRSALLSADASLAAGNYSWSIHTVDVAGNGAQYTFSVPVSTTYFLTASASHAATNCQSATGGQYDMELNAALGTETSRTGPGPFDRVSFCSDSFSAGASLPPGTTTVSLTYQNTSTSKSCDMTVTLWRNTVQLGTALRTIGPNTGRTTGTWSFATSATSFAAGDRLVMTVDYKPGNLCNGATFFWNSTSAPSKVVTP